jgi:3-oxoacyl-ACP reductase-like protein
MATVPLAAPPAAAATAAATNVPDIFIFHASTIIYCKLSCRYKKNYKNVFSPCIAGDVWQHAV